MTKNKSGRIPVVIDTFNAYINNTERYLRALSSVPAPPTTATAPAVAAAAAPLYNWQRLTMLITEMDAWTNFKNQWNALYILYSDKGESRTTAITVKLRDVQSAFKTFARPLLKMISGIRTVTTDDAEVLHIVLNPAEPVHPVTPIEAVPVFGMKPLGGGDVKFSVRPFQDTKRASKLPGAEIEVRYIVQPAGDIPPAHVDNLPTQYISSKAIFLLHCGTGNIEKVLYTACRWIVVNDPSRNGQWTTVQHSAIA